MTQETTIRPTILWGMMGSGKTTIGRALATQLERPFFDLDALVSQHTGMPIERLFTERGEEFFRHREQEVLTRLLKDVPDAVIAVGGGALLTPSFRDHIRQRAFVITLEASISVLLERVGSGDGRPLLAGDGQTVKQRLEGLLAERHLQYLDVDHCVSTDAGTPIEIAEQIACHRCLGMAA